jgi:NHLM bacteriocin system ABC transporter ATP-binding protein
MATFVAQKISSQAGQSLVARSPFTVEDPNSVWWIQSGSLDVFLTNLIDGRPEGTRFPVVRLESGQAVFGVGASLENQVLIAVISPGAKILRLSLDEFRERAFAQGEDVAARLLENWVDRLTCAVSEDSHLGQFVYLEAGEKVLVPAPTRALLSKQGLVWANHAEGGSIFRNAFHLLGDPRLPFIAGACYFPVTRHSWLQSSPGSEVSAIGADEVWKEDPELTGLQKFHQIAMVFLAIKHEKAEAKEKEAMRTRAAADASMLQTALLRLTAPIRKLAAFKSGEDRCHNLTFLASEAVGRKLRLEIKPHPDMLQGLRVADPVEAIARTSGVRTRTVVLRGQWWKEDIGPLLGSIEEGKKPVAILPRTGKGYVLYHPETKATIPITAAVAATLNPFGHVFYRPLPAKKVGLLELIKFVLPMCWQELLLIVLTGLAAGLLASVTPAATGIIFDTLIPGAERSQLGQMLVILLIVACTMAMFTFVRNFVVLRIEGKLDAFIQAAVWDRLLSLPVSFFRKYSSGDLAQRSMGIATIRRTLTGSTMSAIFSGIFSFFSFLLLFYYSWILALVATGLVSFAFVVTTSCGILQVRLQRRIAHINGAISSMVLQFINGIAKFRVSGTEARAFAVWAREFSAKKVISTRSRHIMNALKVFVACFPVLSLAVIFYVHQDLSTAAQMGSAAAQASKFKITTGEFLAFFGAFIQFMTSVLLLGAAIVGAVAVIPSYERAKPIFDAIPEVTDQMASPGKLTGGIEVSHLTFRYQADGPPVLNDVSINIQAGQFVAVVGASGSGKSTLLRLLLAFEKPESGAIYFDGQNLAGINVQEVRRQMGVVLQSSRPVSGSVFQNIVGSAPLAVEDAWEAARLAGIDEDIRKMPMGLHTYLSDGGGGISGGQRQRLMIARAIAPRPRIVLFDEATSALDNQTQAIVSRSLESLRATRVVIAHRLSTIKNADCIFVLDKGNIVQSGTYEELIAQDGPFRELTQRQMI